MDLSSVAMILIGLVMTIWLIATLYAIACHVLRAIHVHNVTIEAHKLRDQYARRLEALRSGMVMDVEMLTPGLDSPDLVGVDIIDEGDLGTSR